VKEFDGMKFPKWLLIILAIVFSCSIIYWVSERPRYIDIPISIPKNDWDQSTYSIKKQEYSGAKSYILRKETMLNFRNDQETEIQDVEGMIDYFNEKLFDHGWEMLSEGTSAYCEWLIPESAYLSEIQNRYLARYRPIGADQFSKVGEVCLAIIYSFDNCGGSYDVIFVTKNDYWFDVLAYEFAHPH